MTADAGYRFNEKSIETKAGFQAMILFFGLSLFFHFFQHSTFGTNFHSLELNNQQLRKWITRKIPHKYAGIFLVIAR